MSLVLNDGNENVAVMTNTFLPFGIDRNELVQRRRVRDRRTMRHDGDRCGNGAFLIPSLFVVFVHFSKKESVS